MSDELDTTTSDNPDEQPERTATNPPSGLMDPRLRGTLFLVSICAACLIYLTTFATVSDSFQAMLAKLLGSSLRGTLLDAGAFAGFLLEAGEYWRLVASLFLHKGLFHFLLNMYVLFFFSVWLELLLGTRRYLVLFVVAGVAGNLFGYSIDALLWLFHAHSEVSVAASLRLTVGASVSVFGLVGAIVAAEWVGSGALRAVAASPHLRRMIVLPAILLLIGVMADCASATAHLGGFFAGLAMGLFFFGRRARRERPQFHSLGLNALYGLTAFCVVALFASGFPARSSGEIDEARDETVIYMLRTYGRSDIALKWVDRRAVASGESLVWRTRRAEMLVATCRYEAARDEVDATISTTSESAKLLYHRAVCHWRLGSLEQASEDFAAATASAQSETTGSLPSWIEALEVSHALALRELDREEESRAIRERLANRLRASIITASRALKSMGAADDDPASTRTRGRQAQEIQLTLAITQNHLAWLHAVFNEHVDEGLEIIQLAINNDSAVRGGPDAALVDTLGWLLYRKGRHIEALETLLSATRSEMNDSAEILYHVGAAYAALGDYAEAKRFLEASLESKQDFDAIREASKLLESLGPEAMENPDPELIVRVWPSRPLLGMT